MRRATEPAISPRTATSHRIPSSDWDPVSKLDTLGIDDRFQQVRAI